MVCSKFEIISKELEINFDTTVNNGLVPTSIKIPKILIITAFFGD
jgi:hypothetical protein